MPSTSTLSIIEVGEKERTVMRSLLNVARLGGTDGGWQIVEEPGGDITIVDVDSEAGAARWKELRESGAVVFALTVDRSFDADRVLHKPLRSREFMDLLKGIKQEQPMPTQEQAEAIEITPERVEWLRMDLSPGSDRVTLAEHLRRGSWRQPVMLVAEGWPRLVIDAGSGIWYFQGSLTGIGPELFSETLPVEAGVPLSSTDLADEAESSRHHPLSELKWYAGLVQSRGGLHPDLLGNVQFMLTRAPSEAMDNPRFAALARVLLREPLGLDELHEASGESPADIACFLNACYTTGRLLLNRSAERAAGF